MTLMKTLLIVIVASACALAQNPVASTKTTVKSATESKNAAVQKAQPAPAQKTVAASKPAVKAAPALKPSAASKPTAKAAPTAAKTAATATAVAKPAATSAKAPTKEAQVASKGPQRDPFVSPIVQKVTSSVSCTGGKKCLEPTQVILKGVVSSDNGRIAVVTNPANKAYFLREQDPVLNGYVIRITGDSIVFRENVTDRLGKVSQREVVKKVSAPAV
jgi:hypothetical protein